MYDTSKRLSMPLLDNYSPVDHSIGPVEQVRSKKPWSGRSKLPAVQPLWLNFRSTSGLQDSLTYMYYTSKGLYMSLLYKYIQ